MKFFFNTHFIEGFKKPVFSKKRHFIDLISIGITDKDGREYYAISNEFNPSDANEWVNKNVLRPIADAYDPMVYGDSRDMFFKEYNKKTLTGKINYIQQQIGKTNRQIANEVRAFVYDKYLKKGYILSKLDDATKAFLAEHPVGFYGYYCAYQWVCLATLFGGMDDLPKGFPFYANDLQQSVDATHPDHWKITPFPEAVKVRNALVDAKWNMALFNALPKK